MSTKSAVNVGVVGATGLVGELFLTLIAERRFPLGEVRLFASDRSVGLMRKVNGRDIRVETPSPGCFRGLDVVFFSSGDDVSKEWAPKAVAEGAVVIDNSAAFRMDEDKLLIVPEVNGHRLPARGTPALIANPNCSTIQLVCALDPLRRDFGLESVHVASYQAVSGAGKAAHDELISQLKAWPEGKTGTPQVFPHPIAMNCIPQIGGFSDNGFCSEELKIMRESKKIMEDKSFRISAVTVRIPAWNAHSEAVWVRLKNKPSRTDVINSLKKQKGLVIEDDPKSASYPTALKFNGLNAVGVGRIHQDLDDPNTWILWIVADNLRKGAALNGLQIAEQIFDISPPAC